MPKSPFAIARRNKKGLLIPTLPIMKKIVFVLGVLLTTGCVAAKSKCTLPSPDGGEPGKVSDRNLAGYLIDKKNNKIFIKEYRTNKTIKVDVSEIDTPYSAFGGDAPFSELVPGIAVRIWYKNCRKSAINLPKAAYFEFFANSKEDQPPESYFTQKGQ